MNGQVSSDSVDEYIRNLKSALQSATPHYGVPPQQVHDTIKWLVDWLINNKMCPAIPAVAATISVAERHDVSDNDVRQILKELASVNLAATIVDIDLTLTKLSCLTETCTTGYAG